MPRRQPATRPPLGRQLLSPFTGEPVRSLGPVLAVKIDNIVYARPQTGLTSADIVYVLPVEGGLSRFLAIFSSHLPPVIGPVRSAREDDLELLRQFGRPAFAFSGAQPQLLPVVEHSRIVDLYAGLVSGYYRGPGRIAPYNLFARTAALLAEAKGASRAHSIGFTFGPAPAGGQRDAVDDGFLLIGFVHVQVVSAGGPLAGLDGWPQSRQHGGASAVRGDGRDPVHDRQDLQIPGAGTAPAVRGDHRERHRGRAAQRESLPGPLVAADRQTAAPRSRPGSGQPMTVRARPGVDRADGPAIMEPLWRTC